MLKEDNSDLRAANAEVQALLAEAAAGLRAVLDDEAIVEGTPIEATTAVELALETIEAAIARLNAVTGARRRRAVPPRSPTRPAASS